MVSYNSSDLISKCLASIYRETKTDFEVVVVDNQSSDDTVSRVRENFPNVNLVVSEVNGGFASGVNQGFSHCSGDMILLLNPDTLILDSAIDRLVSFSQEYPDNGIWGGVTLNDDKTINTQHAWSYHSTKQLLFSALGLSKFFENSDFFNGNNYGSWDRNSIKDVDIISGCFFLTSRDLWLKLDGLDETYFMYAEEADFCKRALGFGNRPKVCPDSRIVHHGGASHSNFSSKMLKLLTGKCEFILRYDSSLNAKLNIFLLKLYVFNKILVSMLKPSNLTAQREWKKVFSYRRDWSKGYR